MSNSQQNELAEFGYKYRELKDKQINVMGAYDAENNRQLISKAMRGSLPDKLYVHELFAAFKFHKKVFLADSGFYSEENLGYFRADGNHFIIPVPDSCVIVKMIKKDPVITDIKEMLEYDLKEAAEALPAMSKALALFDDDYVTRHMIEEFILDEQEHYNWVKGHLCLIEQIGMENYLIEQLGE